jgi:CDP-diacylglycerol--glycerol-3-phosphate 3-phosphatidyltransferase
MQRAERVILLSAPQAFFGLALHGYVLMGVIILLTITAWHTAILRINYVRTSTVGGESPALHVVTDKSASPSNRSSLRAKP